MKNHTLTHALILCMETMHVDTEQNIAILEVKSFIFTLASTNEIIVHVHVHKTIRVVKL